jgi:hypothetical protein
VVDEAVDTDNLRLSSRTFVTVDTGSGTLGRDSITLSTLSSTDMIVWVVVPIVYFLADFDFEKLGIGGLDEEFNEIFSSCLCQSDFCPLMSLLKWALLISEVCYCLDHRAVEKH